MTDFALCLGTAFDAQKKRCPLRFKCQRWVNNDKGEEFSPNQNWVLCDYKNGKCVNFVKQEQR